MKPVNTTAIAPRQQPKDYLGILRSNLEAKKEQMASLLAGSGITPERMTNIIYMAMVRNPFLQKCDRGSIVECAITACELQLEIGGILGQAYFLPFNKRYKDENNTWQSKYIATFVCGYKGLIDLVCRSGKVESITARAIHERDSYRVRYGTADELEHEPAMGDRGALLGVYAVAKFRGGGTKWEFMTLSEVDDVARKSPSAVDENGRKTNQVPTKGPWHDHYEEMAKKTVVRRLCKTLPMDSQTRERYEKAITVDADWQDADAAAGALPSPAFNPQTGEVEGGDPPPPPPPQNVINATARPTTPVNLVNDDVPPPTDADNSF